MLALNSSRIIVRPQSGPTGIIIMKAMITQTHKLLHRAASSISSSQGSSSNKISSRQCMSTMMTEAYSPEEDSRFALILGKPGGGKGTISGKILTDFPQFHHVSSGDILREHVRQETTLGKQAYRYMQAGKLVPDELMIGLVLEESAPYLSRGESLLLDGFPRTVVQAQALEQEVSIDIIVNLEIPTDTIVERLTDRWIHEPSGRIYSYGYKPPQTHGLDDLTGEPLIQRPDDQPETVRARLLQYDEATLPLVQYYESKPLHHTINGGGKDGDVLKTFRGTQSDIIYPQVKDWLTSFF
mmetsp:Transcript_12584/g.14436  ORF Transcript_12584/g.14436 Transcript_12584/m.14436 type:complete len:298 (-) Transcript_12584:151-1044(-)